MSAGDVFSTAFLVALGALLAWLLVERVLRPALVFLLEEGRTVLTQRATVTALESRLAVARYLAAGMSPDEGMPTLAELQWLHRLNAADRFGWASNVIADFERSLPAGKAADYTAVLDDLGLAPQTPMRAPVALYLETVAQGFPIVGTWRWTRS